MAQERGEDLGLFQQGFSDVGKNLADLWKLIGDAGLSSAARECLEPLAGI